MIGPVLRLVAIYLLVALAVVGLMKRDRVLAFFGVGAAGERPAVHAQDEGSAPAAENAARQAQPGAQEPAPLGAPVADAVQGMARSAAQSATRSGASEPAPLQAPLQAPQPAPAQAPLGTPAPPAAAPAPASTTSREQLYEARRTYWDRTPAEAIAIYRELLKADPDNIELNGELGNIYYMEGQRQDAARHYRRAAEAAIRAGERAQAEQLVSALRGLDPEAARALEARLGGRP